MSTLGLGILTVSGLVQLWQVYLFAFLLGCAADVCFRVEAHMSSCNGM
jgi:hypothetical protein